MQKREQYGGWQNKNDFVITQSGEEEGDNTLLLYILQLFFVTLAL